MYPDLEKVWNHLSYFGKAIEGMPFLDPRFLRSSRLTRQSGPSVSATELSLALWAMVETGKYQPVLKVEDPFDKQLLGEDFRHLREIPKVLTNEQDREFKLDQAEVVLVLREAK